MTVPPSDSPRPLPKQERAQQTYELLLDVAGELLAEVGIERISTNLICARAGLTPPALYRYFKDKYSVLEALGLRLMERQNAVLEAWRRRTGRQPMHVSPRLRERSAIPARGGAAAALWVLTSR